MTTIDLLEQLTSTAKRYCKEANESIQRNRHMNDIQEGEVIQQAHIEAVLVDFINKIGFNHGCNYVIHTVDLRK